MNNIILDPWEDIDSYMITMFNIVLSNKYKNNYIIRNYARWYNYWINIYESCNIFNPLHE
jgi:hypothetical protein